MDVRSAIRRFLSENFYVEADDALLPDDASLLESGVVDSTGVMEVVAFLEEELGVVVEDTELVPENLDSVRAIEALVARKRAGAA